MKHILAIAHARYRDMANRLAQKTGDEFIVIDKPEDLSPERVAEIRPQYVFFPHWSWIIPESIWARHECVVFHMTDLPFGRGGSPLQNLIVRGINETKISALRCVKELDAGPIYLKHPLSLDGTAEEIFQRAALIMEDMIEEILRTRPTPVAQSGPVTVFERRNPEDGNIAGLTDIHQVYDYIRMLDADGYPKAHLEVGGLRLEFSGADLGDGGLNAKVRIALKSSRCE